MDVVEGRRDASVWLRTIGAFLPNRAAHASRVFSFAFTSSSSTPSTSPPPIQPRSHHHDVICTSKSTISRTCNPRQVLNTITNENIFWVSSARQKTVERGILPSNDEEQKNNVYVGHVVMRYGLYNRSGSALVSFSLSTIVNMKSTRVSSR